MESASGCVSKVSGGIATVVVAAPLACPRCASGKGCGAGLLGGSQAPRQLEISVPPGMHLQAGDAVTLTVAPRQLLRGAVLAYGLPLLAMLLSVAMAAALNGSPGDILPAGVGIAGLVSGIWLSRRYLRRDTACAHFMPIIETHGGAEN